MGEYNKGDVYIKSDSIQFHATTENGSFILNTVDMLQKWGKRALMKFINEEIIGNWKIESFEKILILQKIESVMLNEFEYYKFIHERYHTKQAEKNVGYCLDIAEYCRINGRDKG